MDSRTKMAGARTYEAIDFLQRMNRSDVYGEVPGIMTLAEESTAFPGVSRPVDAMAGSASASSGTWAG